MAFLGAVGSLLWRGDTGSSAKDNMSKSYLGPLVSATLLHDFADGVEPYSECNLNNYYWVGSYSQTAGAPATGSNIDRKAVIYFRDPGDMKVKHFQYPEPLVAHIETTPWGKRIKQTTVVQVVALLSTVSGISYVPLYGTYYQRK